MRKKVKTAIISFEGEGEWGTLTLEEYFEKVMKLIGIKKYWFLKYSEQIE